MIGRDEGAGWPIVVAELQLRRKSEGRETWKAGGRALESACASATPSPKVAGAGAGAELETGVWAWWRAQLDANVGKGSLRCWGLG